MRGAGPCGRIGSRLASRSTRTGGLIEGARRGGGARSTARSGARSGAMRPDAGPASGIIRPRGGWPGLGWFMGDGIIWSGAGRVGATVWGAFSGRAAGGMARGSSVRCGRSTPRARRSGAFAVSGLGTGRDGSPDLSAGILDGAGRKAGVARSWRSSGETAGSGVRCPAAGCRAARSWATRSTGARRCSRLGPGAGGGMFGSFAAAVSFARVGRAGAATPARAARDGRR